MPSAEDGKQDPFPADLGNGRDEPLKLTKIPFQNVEQTVPHPDPAYASYGVRMGTGKWSKKPSIYGAFTEYRYGSVTTVDTPGVEVIRYPTDEPVEAVQVGVVCSPESGLVVIDVDDPEAYAESDLGDDLPLELAFTRRGEGGHILLDYRHVPREKWPTQGPIQGGDIKSAGFVAAAGSLHYSGDRYERTGNPILVVTEEEVEAVLAAKRQATGSSRPGAYRGDGHGDDDHLARSTYGWVFQGLDEAEVQELWQELADEIEDPSWPFTERDFQRHYRGAVRKHERHQEARQEELKAEEEARQQARQAMLDRLDRARTRSREVREEARQSFIQNPGNTALREETKSCVPEVSYEDGSQLISGKGSIVTSLGMIAKIRKYEAELWSADWAQQAPERLLALSILGKLRDGETVHASAPCFDEQRATLDSLLKNHPALLGQTQDGRIVALQDEGEVKDHSWFCARCSNTHRLSHWEGLPIEIVLAEGCPLDTGIDVTHSRRGQERLVAVIRRLRQELEDKAKAEGRPVNPTKDRVTGRMLVRAWNEGERGEFACLSINKANRLLRKLAQKGELLIRLRKARNYLRNHRCRTASPVYGLPSECPELASPDPQVRAQAEERLRIQDDLEWTRFWMRREQVQADLREQRTAVAA